MDKYELFIVGVGAAGMSAAVAAWENGARSILIADRSDRPGGVLPQCIHHGFGLSTFGEELTGPEYAARITEKLSKTNAELSLSTTVLSIAPDRTAVLSGREGVRQMAFDRALLSTGCRENSIGALTIAGTRPAGIFTAGQAQELINLHKQDIGSKVLVLGSGDLGMIIARRLVLEGKQVIAVVEREAHYGGMARNYRRCIEEHSIPLVCGAEITRISGEERVESVTLRHMDSGSCEIIPCDTLVTALGLTPERSLAARLGVPEWLGLCGNCSRVHDIVDSAVDEAQRIGKVFSG